MTAAPDRADYHRCRHCKQLFRDDECEQDETGGLICPNRCQENFVQPPYESPLNE